MNAPQHASVIEQSIQIANITPEQMSNAAKFTAGNGICGLGGNAGIITADQVEVRYDYSPDTGIVTLQPTRLSAQLGSLPAATAMAVLKQYLLASLNALDNWPSHAGVYNYVVPTIVNSSGNKLSFSSSNINPGTVINVAQTIDINKTVPAFEADSIVLAWDGTGGTMVYSFPDGVTTLNINWYLNTVVTHTFTAGVSGGNATRYNVVTTNTEPVLAGYTYLMPTITITKS